ncbi:ABC transporter permease [Ideonella sp. 4Y16]|uniref:MlaE family ABC transporter permease n=1 Tax=Ideonella alba TaxID=2824118 RepID=UPI001B36949E|nr:ABC transporter permease [Ideonella alba]MBQ0943837.1 ABC transporter permease [Ideonella alba]
MADSADRIPPAAHWQADGPLATLDLRGDWRAPEASAAWPGLGGLPATARRVQVRADALQAWDSRLAARLWQLGADLARREPAVPLDLAALPSGLREVLSLASASSAAAPVPPEPGVLSRLGLLLTRFVERATVTLGFVGETLMALGRLLRGRTAMRGQDLVHQLWATGPSSLPIVSLVSALVGLIIAYLGAAQLQRFGAQIYMADLVTIGEVREVAALMTAVILAGRVGAAFAAQLGSMQANEEIDALRTLGLDPVEHLVLPRTIALTLMAPLLTVYAAGVAMIAGMFVAVGIFRVEPLEYLVRSFNALSLAHVSIGLLKATVYGLLVALAGCRQGLHAGRSAQAVGEATTAAVVQAIVWIVVAASALTISFQRLGW